MSQPKLITIAALSALIGCNANPSPRHAERLEPTPVSAKRAAEPAQAAITRAEPSQVCMINNQYMGKPQIPVVIKGKTYFGCCAMCKGRLEQDAESRMATDPVSGARVDKADAVIGKAASGEVFYFESEDNLRRYTVEAPKQQQAAR